MYESKLYVMNEKEYPYSEDYHGEKDGYNQRIAVFDMGALPMDFLDVFTEKLKYPLYCDEGDNEEEIKEDKYGKELLKSDIKPVMEKIYGYMQKDNYRRFKPFYSFLAALNPDEWEHLIVINYGY